MTWLVYILCPWLLWYLMTLTDSWIVENIVFWHIQNSHFSRSTGNFLSEGYEDVTTFTWNSYQIVTIYRLGMKVWEESVCSCCLLTTLYLHRKRQNYRDIANCSNISGYLKSQAFIIIKALKTITNVKSLKIVFLLLFTWILQFNL